MTERRSLRKLEVPSHIRIAYNSNDDPVVRDYWVDSKEDLNRLLKLGARYYIPSETAEQPPETNEPTPLEQNGAEPNPDEDETQTRLEKNRRRYTQVIEKMRSTYKSVLEDRIPFSSLKNKFKDDIEYFLGETKSDPTSVSALIHIENYDDETFEHSLNVCLFSTLYGEFRKYSLEKLKKIAFGALFHDIGKTAISRDIIRKPQSLSEEELQQIKLHPKKGRDILEDIGADDIYCTIALEHHERPEGNGYPNEIETLHPISRIVAVCDVYEALTADRIYKDKMKPVKAFMVLKDEFGDNPETREIVAGLIQCLGIFPVGSLVRLSNNETGIVKKVHPDAPRKPTVVIIRDRNNNLLDAPVTVNMKRLTDQKKGGHGEVYDDTLSIESLLSIDNHPELEGRVADLLEKDETIPI